MLLIFEADHLDVNARITLLMREAPLLPSCFCSAGLGDLAPSKNDANGAGAEGEAGQGRV